MIWFLKLTSFCDTWKKRTLFRINFLDFLSKLVFFFLLKALKSKTLERKIGLSKKVKFFYPLFSILKPLQCEALEEIFK